MTKEELEKLIEELVEQHGIENAEGIHIGARRMYEHMQAEVDRLRDKVSLLSKCVDAANRWWSEKVLLYIENHSNGVELELWAKAKEVLG